MHFISLLRASLVIVVVASMVCNSDATIYYVNGTTFFGSCVNFAIMAGAAVAFNGALTTVYTGDVGVSPAAGTSITGTYLLATGSLQPDNSAAINCAADDLKAYNQLKGLVCTASNTLGPNLSGLTLLPGVYCTSSGFYTTTATMVTLNGTGDSNSQFIFQMATTLTTATGTSFILKNGAQAKNVYWQVGSSATLALSSSFVGNMLAGAAISVNTGTTIVGRLMAQTAVTFAGLDSITLP